MREKPIKFLNPLSPVSERMTISPLTGNGFGEVKE
jgi:hypothetical protein